LPSSDAIADSTNRSRALRIAVSTLIALFATLAPSLALYSVTGIGPGSYEGAEFLFFYLPLVIGSFVFVSLERPQPEWLHGVVFGFGVAVGVTVFMLCMFFASDRPDGPALVAGGLTFTVMGALLGMAGSGVAVLVSRPLAAGRADGRRKRMKPWHLGAAVTMADVGNSGSAHGQLRPGLTGPRTPPGGVQPSPPLRSKSCDSIIFCSSVASTSSTLSRSPSSVATPYCLAEDMA
jgi:hypothetical protein